MECHCHDFLTMPTNHMLLSRYALDGEALAPKHKSFLWVCVKVTSGSSICNNITLRIGS